MDSINYSIILPSSSRWLKYLTQKERKYTISFPHSSATQFTKAQTRCSQDTWEDNRHKHSAPHHREHLKMAFNGPHKMTIAFPHTEKVLL